MKRVSTTSIVLAPTDTGAVGKAWDEVSASFDRFCLAAGVDALGAMMEKDAEEACGARHVRSAGRRGHRWGRTQGKIGFQPKARRSRPSTRATAVSRFAGVRRLILKDRAMHGRRFTSGVSFST